MRFVVLSPQQGRKNCHQRPGGIETATAKVTGVVLATGLRYQAPAGGETVRTFLGLADGKSLRVTHEAMGGARDGWRRAR